MTVRIRLANAICEPVLLCCIFLNYSLNKDEVEVEVGANTEKMSENVSV